MTAETKHHLIVGGGLIAAVIIGIVFYKRYQAGSSASQAAADQQNADQLAFLESQALTNPYDAGYGAGGSSITIPAASSGPSLIDQLNQIEQAFGFAPTPSASTPSTPSTGSGSTPPPPAGSGSPSLGTPGAKLPGAPAKQKFQLDSSLPQMTLEHEAFVQ
jgi:hypothetical protein